MHDGSVQDCAFIATLMKLTDDRVIKISHRAHSEERLFGMGKKKVEEYSIQLLARELVSDPIDQAALDLYFGPDARTEKRGISARSRIWMTWASTCRASRIR